MSVFCLPILILHLWSPVVSCCPSKVNYLILFASVMVVLSLLMRSWQQNPFTGAFTFLLFVVVIVQNEINGVDAVMKCSCIFWHVSMQIYLKHFFFWELISFTVYPFWKSFVQTLKHQLHFYIQNGEGLCGTNRGCWSSFNSLRREVIGNYDEQVIL